MCLMSALAAFTILKLTSQVLMLGNSHVYPKQKLGYRFAQAQDRGCSENWCSADGYGLHADYNRERGRRLGDSLETRIW